MRNIAIDVPDNRIGNYAVESFHVSEEKAKSFNLRMLFQLQYERKIEPGNYKKLTHNNHVVMSNTPAEINDHYWFCYQAHGTVLLHGLGLGVALKLLLQNKRVTRIIVVEKSQEVIDLVWNSYKQHKNVFLIRADAFEWKPKKQFKFDFIWHDIWDYFGEDEYNESKKLHRKFGRHCNVKQDSWCRQQYLR